MSFGKKEPKSLTVMIVVQAAVILGAAVFLIYVRACDSRSSSSVASSELFPKRSAPAPAAPRTAAPAAPAATSPAAVDPLQYLVPESAPQYAYSRSTKPAESAPAAAPVALPAPVAPSSATALSPEEEAGLKAEVGSFTPEKASLIGSTRGLLFRLGAKGLKYPRLVKLFLNNDYLVEGFMNQPRVRKNCDDKATLANYLTNTSDSSGIRLGLASINTALNTPGSAEAVFGSKLTAAVLKCDGLKALKTDSPTLAAISQANPQMVSMMMDPRLINALSASPAAVGTLNSVQSSLMQRPAPAP
jgi:hypothetical protein